MRPSALIALLPFLATFATAHPQPAHSHGNLNGVSHRERKTLSFGPTHAHASFEVVDTPVVSPHVAGVDDVDPKDVAKQFIAHQVGGKEGEAFYIREDVSDTYAALPSRLNSCSLKQKGMPARRPASLPLVSLLLRFN
jgi:extracellular elastinolytic metalloproteinase